MPYNKSNLITLLYGGYIYETICHPYLPWHYGLEQPVVPASNDSLPHELGIKEASEQTNERSGANEPSRQGGASE